MKTVSTPWGQGTVVEELVVPQRAGERRFGSVVQLLEVDGDVLVRFAYTTDGRARRGPVTLRQRDVERLHASLARCPRLEAALRGGR